MAMAQLQWKSACRTHIGKIRTINEDAYFERPDIGLWIVADGMGGHWGGDLASQIIVNRLANMTHPGNFSVFVEQVHDALKAANKHILRISQKTRQTCGSTVVCLLLQDTHCAYFWAGDSKLYHVRDRDMKQLTTDHSQAEFYVQLGLLSREQACAHPGAHALTRAIGIAEELYVDFDMIEVKCNDRFLLSTDGLGRHLDDGAIAAILNRGGDAGSTSETLVQATLDGGATDNVTVAVVDISASSIRNDEINKSNDDTFSDLNLKELQAKAAFGKP